MAVFLFVALGTPVYMCSQPLWCSQDPPGRGWGVSVLISSESLLVGLSELQIALERESEALALPRNGW